MGAIQMLLLPSCQTVALQRDETLGDHQYCTAVVQG